MSINPAISSFIQEAADLLEGLEDLVLELETDPSPDRVDAVFRTLHTIKGSGAMFGFDTLARFTHHFENAYDLVREGRLKINASLIDLSLRARDHMKAVLECAGDTPEAAVVEASPEAQTLLAAIQKMTGGTEDAPMHARSGSAMTSETLKTFVIQFKPASDDLRNGMRPDLLLAELSQLGAMTFSRDLSDVPPLADLIADQNYTTYNVTLITDQPRSAIEAVFIFADTAELAIEAVSEPVPTAKDTSDKVQPEKATRDGGPTESVRVSASRLDEMMDRLGELVISQARLDQISGRIADAQLETVVEEIERLVTGLRDATLSIRMLPIEVVFGKFRRVVRDLSADLAKDVALITEGGETEIDK